MTKPKGGKEQLGKLSSEYESVWNAIKEDLDSRSSRTRELLEELPITEKDLELIFKLYKIKGKNLAEKTFRLQAKLKMTAEDSREGTDGKFGSYTYGIVAKNMETRFPKVYAKYKKKADVHAKSMAKRRVVASSTVRSSGALSTGTYTATETEKIRKGALPFTPPAVGKEVSDKWYRWYRKQYIRANNPNTLLSIMEKRYKYVQDGLKRQIKLLGFQNKPKWFKKYVVLYNLSMGKVESDHHPQCVSGLGWKDWKTKTIDGKKVKIRRGPRARKGPELGMYQFQDRYWKRTAKSEGMRIRYFVKQRGKGIDYSALEGMNFNEESVGDLGPTKQGILFALNVIGGSRHSRYTNVEEIFEKIHNSSGKTKDTWIKMLRLKWLMGKSGAEKVIGLVKNDPDSFPTNATEANSYWIKHIKGTKLAKEISQRILRIAASSSKKFVKYWKNAEKKLDIDALGI